MNLSVSEIIDMAIGIEEAGYEFYTRASAIAKDEKAKETLLHLASQERSHKAIFSALVIPEVEASDMPNDEYYLYLKEIGAVKIFNENEVLKTERSIIEYALGAEKNSVLLYSELIGFLPEADKTKVERIIDEEKNHLVILSKILNSLK